MYKAISLLQPWVDLILYHGKDVENRSWPTNFRGPVLLHASKGWDRDSFPVHRRVDLPVPATVLPRRLWPYLDKLPKSIDAYNRGGIVGYAEIVGCVRISTSPWFFGPYGFVLANVRPLPFVPCKGALNFWEVPEDVLKAVGL